jgi:hypothetical protein
MKKISVGTLTSGRRRIENFDTGIGLDQSNETDSVRKANEKHGFGNACK